MLKANKREVNLTMSINQIISLISLFFTVVSFLYAIYCHYKMQQAEKRTRTINWQDVSDGSKYLAKMIGEHHKPDIIYIPNIKSGIIVHFIKDYFMEYIPIIVGQSISKKQFEVDSISKIIDIDNYLFFESNKWYSFIPMNILDYKDKKLLIIDDFAMSGDFLKLLKNTLKNAGFKNENISTMCLATTEVAIQSENAPTFFWKDFSTTDIYMPWGKPI